MELNLHPIATKCCVTGREFQEGDRVVCYLVREDASAGATPGTGGIGRRDLLESADAGQVWTVSIFCRWVVEYKMRRGEENADRALKLTAENLFLTLADPDNPPSETNTPLLQFLALLLERKRLLKARGITTDGERQILEHMPSHRLYEVPVGTLDEAFFVRIQEQLGVLVGTPKPKPAAVPQTAAAT